MIALTTERQRDVFGGLLVIPSKSFAGAVFTYRPSPSQVLSLGAGNSLVYNLSIQKQPGAHPEPLKITIDLPAHTVLQSVSPSPTYADDTVVYFEGNLDSDMAIQLIFTVPDTIMKNVLPLFSGKQVAESITPTPRVVATGLPLPTLGPTPAVSATVTPVGASGRSGSQIVTTVLVRSNLMAGPGPSYATIETLEQGTQVSLLGRNLAADWVFLRSPSNKKGWLAVDVLKQPFDIFKLVRIVWSTPTPAR
jgi:hypothetical protein